MAELHYPEDPAESYGCLECGWDVPLVNGQIPALCEECGDPASEGQALELEPVDPPPRHPNCRCELEWWTDTTAQVLDEPDAEGARMGSDRTELPPSADVPSLGGSSAGETHG